MKKIFFIISLLIVIVAKSQPTISPAPPQQGTIALTHATIHIGNGDAIQDGMIVFSNGKIINIGATTNVADAKVIDCSGKQIYPGLISANTNLGLNEIGAVRSTRDEYVLGDINTDIRSLVAYNTDSKIINTLKANGILLAGVTPQGGTITGSSSVVQLDAWNWEDASYRTDAGMHL